MRNKLLAVILILALVASCCLSASASSPSAVISLNGYHKATGYEYVAMGYYPYSATGTPEPVLWRVLSVNGDVALLRSEYVLDVYRGTRYTTASNIVNSLGHDLLSTPAIIDATIASTFDLADEAYGYFPGETHETRRIEASPYAAAQGVPTDNGYASYWTHDNGVPSLVTPNGGVITVKRTMDLGVVPLITVSIKQLQLDSGSGTKEDPYYSKALMQDQWLKNTTLFTFPDSPFAMYSVHNPARSRMKVYTAPSEYAHRPTGASINKHGTHVAVLGTEGAWALIEYKVGSASSTRYKTGYFYIKDLRSGSYHSTMFELPDADQPATVISDVLLYDDRNLVSQPLYTLPAGTKVRYMFYTVHNGLELAYIEASVYDKPARGFVLLSELNFD